MKIYILHRLFSNNSFHSSAVWSRGLWFEIESDFLLQWNAPVRIDPDQIIPMFREKKNIIHAVHNNTLCQLLELNCPLSRTKRAHCPHKWLASITISRIQTIFTMKDKLEEKCALPLHSRSTCNSISLFSEQTSKPKCISCNDWVHYSQIKQNK